MVSSSVMYPRVLIAARETALRAALARALISAGFAVELAEGTSRARQVAAAREVGFAIVAPSGFGSDGIGLARDLAVSVGGLIVVADSPEEASRFVGLDLGADAYLSQPLDATCVVDRVRATLSGQSHVEQEERPPEIFSFENYTFDIPGALLLDPSGQPVPMTRTQFALLSVFVRRPGRVLTREQISEAVTGSRSREYDRSVDVLVSRLRHKIEPDPSSPRLIITFPGTGYKFVPIPKRVAAPQRIDDTLLTNVDPPEPHAALVSSLPIASASPGTDQDRPTSPPTIERRQVTIVSCELVGFAALARIDPEDLHDLITSFHTRCVDTLRSFGGAIAHFTGEQLLASFGYPVAREDDTAQAARAAFALVSAVGQVSGPTDSLQLHVGISTGLAVVGDLTGANAESSIVGEIRTVADALRCRAGPNTIVVDSVTRHLLGDLFEYREIRDTDASSVDDPIGWQLIRPNWLYNRFRAQHGTLLTPLVGRDEEIDLLLRRWHRVKSCDMQMVLITGEAGIGKSRLTFELQERLRNERYTCLEYSCSPHHEASTLYPIIRQLEYAAGFVRTDAAAAKAGKLAELLSQAGLAGEDVAVLNELLALPTLTSNSLPRRTAREKRQQTFAALIGHLEIVSRQLPVLMVFEDAHWSDPTSLELLDLVFKRLLDRPILLLVTHRPEVEPPWTGQARVTKLTLSRLDRKEGAALVHRVVGADRLPIEVVDQIAERADGVPLFVEELSKTMLEAESGIAGAPSKSALASIPAIPASLQASLMARLDRLDPAAKHIAQIGAAIGRTFSYELTAAVAEPIGIAVEPGLERLIDTGLVSRQGSAANAQFVFKHGLVQDAAYLTLIRSKRRQIHAGIAQALETLFSETCEQHPEILGHHFTEAADPEKALKYWRLAVEHALRTSAYREAIRHCTSGLSIINSIERREKRLREELSFQLQLGVASTASLGPSSPAMRDSFGRAAEIAEELQDDRSLAGAVLGLWAHHNAQARLQPALALADRLIAIAEARDDDALRVRGHAASLTVSYKMGALESAWQHFESGTSLYRPDMRVIDVIPNYVAPGPDLLLHGSFVAWVMGYPERARKLAAETMAAAQPLAQPYTITHCVYMLGHLAELQGDWPAVRRANEQTVELATHWGFTGTLELVSRRIALVAVVTERDKEQFRHKCEHRQPGFARSLHDVELARMCLTLGMIDRGLALLNETLAYSCETGSSFYDAEVYRTRGQLFAATRRWHDAESSYHNAISTAQQQKARMWELRAATDLALLWRDRGDHQRAADLLHPLYASFTEGCDVRELRAAKALLNELQYIIPQQPPRAINTIA